MIDQTVSTRPIERVLLVDHTAALGGAEIALFNLARALDPRRYQPIILLFSDGPLADRFRAADFETHVIALSADVINTRKDDLGGGTLLRIRDVASTIAFARKVARFMKASGVSLVHTNSLKSDLIGGLAARAAGLPLIWHVRDRIADDYLPAKVATGFRCAARVLPHQVIAISQAVQQTLGNNPRVRVIHDGTPVSVNPAQIQNDGQMVVGLVGRITPWKGQDVFLRAASVVRRQFPHSRFQIIGSALFGEREYEQQLRDFVRSEGLTEVVEFTGFRSDVADLIGRLDLLVHASTTGEPFGQVLIEAMAAGKPVVATRGGAVPEIVLDRQTGLLVPMDNPQEMAEAIAALLSDPVRAKQMGVAGRQRVIDHFTIQKTAWGVEELYDELLHSHNRLQRRPIMPE